MGDNIPLRDDREPIVPQGLRPQGIQRNKLTSASDFLQDNSRTGTLRTRFLKYRRYVVLRLSDIFQNLVTLYVPLFLAHWPRLKRYMDQYPPPGMIDPWVYAARCYISAWMHDLYASNREAVQKLTPLAFSQYYLREEAYYSYEYDQFLILLSASLRPTNISGMMEDTLYIPLLADEIDWNNESNPFNVSNFVLNYDLVNGLIGILKSQKLWNIQTLVTDTIGRPCWLFDWHTDNRCCAWFPAEGNYTMDDVTLAYIVGVACTPNMAPVDVDDWQSFPNRVVPHNIRAEVYPRITNRRFTGAYEVRTLATRNLQAHYSAAVVRIATRKRAKGKGPATASKTATTGDEPATQATPPEESEEGEIEQLDPQFQILDWTYHCLVILNLDNHTRTGSLKMIVEG